MHQVFNKKLAGAKCLTVVHKIWLQFNRIFSIWLVGTWDQNKMKMFSLTASNINQGWEFPMPNIHIINLAFLQRKDFSTNKSNFKLKCDLQKKNYMESSLLFALLSKRYMDPGSGSKCGFFTEFGSASKFKLDLDPHTVYQMRIENAWMFS